MIKFDISKGQLKYFSKGQKVAVWTILGLCILLGVFIPMLLSSNMLFTTRTSRVYVENELSDEDLQSPIDFTYIDEDATEALKLKAESLVPPYFYFSYQKTLNLRRNAEEMYALYTGKLSEEKRKELLYSSTPESYIVMMENVGDNAGVIASIARDCIIHFIDNGVFRQNDIYFITSEKKNELIVEASTELPHSISEQRVSVNQIVTDDSLRAAIYEFIISNFSDLTFSEVQLVADICQTMISPNVYYDELYTEAEKENSKNSVNPVVIQVEKGDYILKTDNLVTAEQLRTLNVLNSKRSYNFSILSLVPRILLSGFIMLFWFWFSLSCITYNYRKAQYTLISLSLMLFSLVAGFISTWALVSMSITHVDAFMPFFLVGMICTCISNKRTYGTSIVFALSALYAMWPTANIMSFFFLVATSSAIILAIKNDKGRFHTIILALKSVVGLIFLTIVFGLLRSASLSSILMDSIAVSVNVIVSFVSYVILLPVLENAFNIPTKQRLYELAYTDNAILNQLSQVAQGTYNHVKNVSELAYAGAMAIGANAELALVGARYHDIGKMVHPEYFVENQNGKNAHDNISSMLSRSVIKSHVRLGMEKGKEIGLPQEILDIIDEHHGNDIIRYFYNEAVKNASENDKVTREDFMYDGNVPSTKESGIVMLADCVEAATRTIKKPNHQKYEKFINSIISDKISHGQLDNSGLTMSDLKIIKEAFIQPLFGRDHQRIAYDNDKD